MTDKEFQLKLDALAKAMRRYRILLEECEAEYGRRFGYHPSDIDDDSWIDNYHIGPPTALTVQYVEENAKDSVSRIDPEDFTEEYIL